MKRNSRNKIFYFLKGTFSFLRRDGQNHFFIWCAIAVIYLLDLIVAWGTNDRYPIWSFSGFYFGDIPDGLVLWILTLITSFMAVYFFTLTTLEGNLLSFFNIDALNFEKNKISIYERMTTLVMKIVLYSSTASLFGFLLSFMIYQKDASLISFANRFLNKDIPPENLFSDFNKTNFLLMNTRFWREEKSGLYIFHVFAAVIRNQPLAFLTSFIFVFYETIKTIDPLRALNIKIKEENRAKDLQIELNNLQKSILSQEDWFHFASNIFNDSRKSLLTMTKNTSNPENFAHNEVVHRLNIFLKELSELFRYRSANSLENYILLKKEINAIKSLEKILQYKDTAFKFDISEMEDDQMEDVKIIPGVIYEYVWNAYKHSQGAIDRAAKIALSVTEHKILTFKIVNTKSNNRNVKNFLNEPSGKGLEVNRKRLMFHYPNRHRIIITDRKDANIYEVNLEIDLN